jgi:hypothetical protein
MAFVESLALAVLQRVLGDYIGGVVTKRQTERNRAELIGLISGHLEAMNSVGSRVDALAVAVRELDVIVRMDRGLDWKGDQLTVRSGGVLRRSPSVYEAFEALEASIQARRQELGLPLSTEEAAAESASIDDDLTPVPPPVARDAGPQWRDRVLGLQSEVLREKERRSRRPGDG